MIEDYSLLLYYMIERLTIVLLRILGIILLYLPLMMKIKAVKKLSY